MNFKSIIAWALAGLVIGSIIAYVISNYFADSKIAEAHADTKVAEAQLTTVVEEKEALRVSLEPQIADLNTQVEVLIDGLSAKDVLITVERERAIRAEERVKVLNEQKQVSIVTVLSADEDELVDQTIELIEKIYPYIEGVEYGYYDEEFVGNRPTAEALAFSLEEVDNSRDTILAHLGRLSAANKETELVTSQRNDVQTALRLEKEGHTKTVTLLDVERKVTLSGAEAIAALNNEIKAYETKWKFDIFSPKCGLGGFAGVGTEGTAAVGLGVFCGWIF